MIRLLLFLVLIMIPSAAQACMFDAANAGKILEEAVFIGMVKIVKVEQPAAMTFPNRPRVTYEVVEVEKRAPGFDDTTIVIESAGQISSCDYAGPWKEGQTVHEIFYRKDGRLQPANINMRAAYDMSKAMKEE